MIYFLSNFVIASSVLLFWLPVQYQKASWKNDAFPTEFRICLRNLFWRAWHARIIFSFPYWENISHGLLGSLSFVDQIKKILWSAAISCVCSKQSLTAPDEFLATTMDDVQVCWCCYWDVDPDVSEAYLMELFLQIFSGRNLRWLHSSVNLRNIFSPSELSNNVGYCCFDSSLVRVL